MKNIKTLLKAGAVAAFVTLVFAGSSFAGIDSCTTNYPRLKIGATAGTEFTAKVGSGTGIYCTTAYEDNKPIKIYGIKSSDCQQASTIVSNPESCNGSDLNSIITIIINTLIFAIVNFVLQALNN